jgi:hypothetical protein
MQVDFDISNLDTVRKQAELQFFESDVVRREV